MRRTLFLALCAVFLSTPAFAEKACTEIGCVNGLSIDLQGTEWPAGHYVFNFLIDNKAQVTCNGTLPLKTCENGPSFECNAEGVTLGESGCALPEQAHAIYNIHMNRIPHKLVMNVMQDGAPFISRTFRPEPMTSQPNGPDCGPVCTSATVSLNKAAQVR